MSAINTRVTYFETYEMGISPPWRGGWSSANILAQTIASSTAFDTLGRGLLRVQGALSDEAWDQVASFLIRFQIEQTPYKRSYHGRTFPHELGISKDVIPLQATTGQEFHLTRLTHDGVTLNGSAIFMIPGMGASWAFGLRNQVKLLQDGYAIFSISYPGIAENQDYPYNGKSGLTVVRDEYMPAVVDYALKNEAEIWPHGLTWLGHSKGSLTLISYMCMHAQEILGSSPLQELFRNTVFVAAPTYPLMDSPVLLILRLIYRAIEESGVRTLKYPLLGEFVRKHNLHHLLTDASLRLKLNTIGALSNGEIDEMFDKAFWPFPIETAYMFHKSMENGHYPGLEHPFPVWNGQRSVFVLGEFDPVANPSTFVAWLMSLPEELRNYYMRNHVGIFPINLNESRKDALTGKTLTTADDVAAALKDGFPMTCLALANTTHADSFLGASSFDQVISPTIRYLNSSSKG